MVGFNDLREWMEKAEQIGELKVIEGADPKNEIGAIVQLNSENRGPALLFDKVKGYKPGFRVLANMMVNMRTFNLTFGLPLENTIQDTIAYLQRKLPEWGEAAEKFPPRVVDSAPILENVEEGDAADLAKFPTPLWHELDGGPYIGTAVGVITKDPDTGRVNMGTYRGQLHDSKSVASYISPGKEGRLHRDKYFARGEPCPMVMVLGFDPLTFAISADEVPSPELELIGAIRGEPVSVIKGKATGLPIPANAEIAIEGFVDPKETKMEGPFGEWPGTYGSTPREEPFLRPVTLYYRNAPILTGSPPAKEFYADHMLLRCLWRSVLIYDELLRARIPNVKGVWCSEFGGSRLLKIVSIKQSYPGHATQVGHLVSQVRAGAYIGRYVIVVDDDIDPFNIGDVLWAMCTRSEPTEIDIIKRSWSGPLDPRIREATHTSHNSQAIIYAVKPYEWFNEFPPTAVASEEVRRQIFSKWKDAVGDRWTHI